MAPSVTQTVTGSGYAANSTYKLHLGQYKEIDGTYLNREAEEGKSGEPAAKVRAMTFIIPA